MLLPFYSAHNDGDKPDYFVNPKYVAFVCEYENRGIKMVEIRTSADRAIGVRDENRTAVETIRKAQEEGGW